jgi:hypothetical protein
MNWLCLSLGGLIGLGALWCLYLGFLRDRSRGRRRCPSCWYDLSTLPGVRCPECGTIAKREEEFARTRIHWRLVVLASVLGCLAWQTAIVGTPGREGWRGLIPTAWYLLIVQDFDDKAVEPMVFRLRHGLVTPWDRWIATHRELTLAEVDWNTCAKVNERWPVTLPLRVWLAIPDWEMQSTFEDRSFTLTSPLARGQRARNSVWPPHIHVNRAGASDNWIDLPAPTLGPNTYEVYLRVRGHSTAFITRRILVHVEGVSSPEQAINKFEAMTIDNVRDVPADIVGRLTWSIVEQPVTGAPALAVRMGEYYRVPALDIDPAPIIPKSFRITLMRGTTEIASQYVSWLATTLDIRDTPLAVTFAPDGTLHLDDLCVRVTPAFDEWLLDGRESGWFGSAERPLRDMPLVIERTPGEEHLDPFATPRRVRVPSSVDRLPLDVSALDELTRDWPILEDD